MLQQQQQQPSTNEETNSYTTTHNVPNEYSHKPRHEQHVNDQRFNTTTTTMATTSTTTTSVSGEKKVFRARRTVTEDHPRTSSVNSAAKDRQTFLGTETSPQSAPVRGYAKKKIELFDSVDRDTLTMSKGQQHGTFASCGASFSPVALELAGVRDYENSSFIYRNCYTGEECSSTCSTPQLNSITLCHQTCDSASPYAAVCHNEALEVTEQTRQQEMKNRCFLSQTSRPSMDFVDAVSQEPMTGVFVLDNSAHSVVSISPSASSTHFALGTVQPESIPSLVISPLSRPPSGWFEGPQSAHFSLRSSHGVIGTPNSLPQHGMSGSSHNCTLLHPCSSSVPLHGNNTSAACSGGGGDGTTTALACSVSCIFDMSSNRTPKQQRSSPCAHYGSSMSDLVMGRSVSMESMLHSTNELECLMDAAAAVTSPPPVVTAVCMPPVLIMHRPPPVPRRSNSSLGSLPEKVESVFDNEEGSEDEENSNDEDAPNSYYCRRRLFSPSPSRWRSSRRYGSRGGGTRRRRRAADAAWDFSSRLQELEQIRVSNHEALEEREMLSAAASDVEMISTKSYHHDRSESGSCTWRQRRREARSSSAPNLHELKDDVSFYKARVGSSSSSSESGENGGSCNSMHERERNSYKSSRCTKEMMLQRSSEKMERHMTVSDDAHVVKTYQEKSAVLQMRSTGKKKQWPCVPSLDAVRISLLTLESGDDRCDVCSGDIAEIQHNVSGGKTIKRRRGASNMKKHHRTDMPRINTATATVTSVAEEEEKDEDEGKEEGEDLGKTGMSNDSKTQRNSTTCNICQRLECCCSLHIKVPMATPRVFLKRTPRSTTLSRGRARLLAWVQRLQLWCRHETVMKFSLGSKLSKEERTELTTPRLQPDHEMEVKDNNNNHVSRRQRRSTTKPRHHKRKSKGYNTGVSNSSSSLSAGTGTQAGGVQFASTSMNATGTLRERRSTNDGASHLPSPAQHVIILATTTTTTTNGGSNTTIMTGTNTITNTTTTIPTTTNLVANTSETIATYAVVFSGDAVEKQTLCSRPVRICTRSLHSRSSPSCSAKQGGRCAIHGSGTNTTTTTTTTSVAATTNTITTNSSFSPFIPICNVTNSTVTASSATAGGRFLPFPRTTGHSIVSSITPLPHRTQSSNPLLSHYTEARVREAMHGDGCMNGIHTDIYHDRSDGLRNESKLTALIEPSLPFSPRQSFQPLRHHGREGAVPFHGFPITRVATHETNTTTTAAASMRGKTTSPHGAVYATVGCARQRDTAPNAASVSFSVPFSSTPSSVAAVSAATGSRAALVSHGTKTISVPSRISSAKTSSTRSLGGFGAARTRFGTSTSACTFLIPSSTTKNVHQLLRCRTNGSSLTNSAHLRRTTPFSLLSETPTFYQNFMRLPTAPS